MTRLGGLFALALLSCGEGSFTEKQDMKNSGGTAGVSSAGEGGEPAATGGSSGSSSGSAGDSPTGGVGGSGGSAVTGGEAGSLVAGSGGLPGTGGSGGTPLCDYAPILRRACSTGVCHTQLATGDPTAGLDLTPDAGLRERLVNVPATHRQIQCYEPQPVYCEPTDPRCSSCASCPTDALLISTENPNASWLLLKLRAHTGDPANPFDMGCGTAMPQRPNPPEGFSYSNADKICLEQMVLAFATGQ